jgi:vacuolar-type H+-ATPase subunit E/Vma4
MASPALFETMSRQVEAECAEHLAAARADADRILADARAKARASTEAALAAAKAERERLDTLWRQKAEAEAVRIELSMRNEVGEAILVQVESEVKRLVSTPQFSTVIESLMAELMGAVRDEKDIHVLGPPAHIDFVRRWLANHGRAGVAVEASEEFWDGVAVQNSARTWRISNTLMGRFARVDQEVRKHFMTTLFGSKGAA